MNVLAVMVTLVGAAFMMIGLKLGRDFRAARERGIRVPARVVGFTTEEGTDSDGDPATYYRTRFEITDGPHVGTVGESSVSTTGRLYDEGDEVVASLDAATGRITGDRATSAMQFGLIGFMLVGAAVALIGIYVV